MLLSTVQSAVCSVPKSSTSGEKATLMKVQKNPDSKRIRKKASSLAGGLSWGKGATDKMEALILASLDTPCLYCGTELHLNTISLDHKEPLIRSLVRHGVYTPSELKKLNSIDNLHLVCRKCNRRKREIPHKKYLKLLKWLEKDPDLKKMILDRLAASNMMWGA